MNSPELVRHSVLVTAILDALIDASGVDRAELEPQLRELDALTIRLAHQCRSACMYHETTRGKDALEHARQIAEQKNAGKKGELVVEQKRWSQEQSVGPKYPGMEPQEVVRTKYFSDGVGLLSPEFKPNKPASSRRRS